MAKTKTKGTAKTVSDTPVPQPITISSTNPKIMADNIKKLEKAIKGADDASEISYDNTESHLTASNVQAAIDEVVTEIGSITSPDASDVTYDNTDSGLTADDVQSAIDEVAPALTAAGTMYSSNVSVKKKLDDIKTVKVNFSSFTYDTSNKYFYSTRPASEYTVQEVIGVLEVRPSSSLCVARGFIRDSDGKISVAGVVVGSTVVSMDDNYTFDVYLLVK